MNQSEAQQLVLNAYNTLTKLYWNCQPGNLQDEISAVQTQLEDVNTNLEQNDIISRTQEFQTLSTQFNTNVLPAIQKLQKDIQADVNQYLVVEGALKDLEMVQSITGFLVMP